MPFVAVIAEHRRPRRSPLLLEWGTVWGSASHRVFVSIPLPQETVSRNPSLSPTIMPIPFNHDLSQWGQPVDSLSDKWRHLAASSYLDASPDPYSASTWTEIRTYVDTSRQNVTVPVNCFGECFLLCLSFDTMSGIRLLLTRVDLVMTYVSAVTSLKFTSAVMSS